MKCKIFERPFAGTLQADVNEWLAGREFKEKPIILQSESMASESTATFEGELAVEKTITISIFFEEI